MESEQVKRAVILLAVTGLSWDDLKQLTWDKIKFDIRKVQFVREKLKKNQDSTSAHFGEKFDKEIAVDWRG